MPQEHEQMDVSPLQPQHGSDFPTFSSCQVDVPLFPNSQNEKSIFEESDISFSDKEDIKSQGHEAIDMPPLEEMDVPSFEDMEVDIPENPVEAAMNNPETPEEPVINNSTKFDIDTFKPSDAFRPSSDSSAAEFIPSFDDSDCSPQQSSKLSSPHNFHGFSPKSPNECMYLSNTN